MLHFLDDTSESPLESLYRLRFARLGFTVRTQIAVPAPEGGYFRVDFELIGYRTFFEADGRAKYTEKQYRNGRSLEELLLDEREREVYVQGAYEYRMLRGGWDAALTTRRTAALLRRYGIEPPRDFERHPLLHLY